jgi:predicted exporter
MTATGPIWQSSSRRGDARALSVVAGVPVTFAVIARRHRDARALPVAAGVPFAFPVIARSDSDAAIPDRVALPLGIADSPRSSQWQWGRQGQRAVQALTARRAAILIWIAMLVACSLVVARLHIETDMSAFLPRTASPAQRVLVDQFRDGIVSRLVLVAIEGVPADRSAAISKAMAQRLTGNPDFVTVENGEASGFARDRDFLWSHRYLLSDRTQADRFTQAGLRTALRHDLEVLGGEGGFLVERTVAADPTGEMLHLLRQQQGGDGPARHDGVWVSPDGSRSLMLVRLRSAGSDIDGAQRALTALHAAFIASASGDRSAKLAVTGPPVFAVQARARIKADATRLSVLASLLVATALLAAYRSPIVLLLGFVPVVSGALAGIASVGLVFRSVHGITLGFGATLIGEAVDYAVYLFTQTGPDSPVAATLRRIWPTLRLGVLTSICGFSAMLLSSFEGFVQLGLFTITGLAVAVCVTRFVLPALIPAGFGGIRQSASMLLIAAVATRGRRLRLCVLVLAAAAAVFLAWDRSAFWAGDLASLSPVPPAEQRLDQALRRDMRAPDAATLIVVRRPDQEAALQAAERLSAALTPLTGSAPTGSAPSGSAPSGSATTGSSLTGSALAKPALAGFDSPSRYLPSTAAQRRRQAALPDPATLQANVDAAADGMPFQPNLFAPFAAAVATARSAPPITRSDLDGTALSLRLDALLARQGDAWVATLSLRGVTDQAAIARAIAVVPDAMLVDLKAQSNRLLLVYLHEGESLAFLGAAAIVVLLALSLRSLPRLLAVTAPLAAAVVVTLAVLRLGGHALSIFNLFGVLLVVAIGSNYCLFFDRQRDDPAGMPRVLASLLLANACTVAGFGVLALSRTPVLHDLGMPVAIGTFLSLVFATIIMSPARLAAPHDAAPR